MIDVSEFQGIILWPKVPKVPILIRITYGVTGLDGKGTSNLAGAKASGHVYGAYHFLEDNDPAAEIDHFLAGWHPVAGGLRGMIDVEPSKFSHPTQAHVVGAYRHYKASTGHLPILYGTHDVLAALRLPSDAAGCPLMMAGYGPNDGREHDPGPPPAPWKTITAHQYTSVGAVPGINGHVDLSSVKNPAALMVPVATRRLVGYTISYIDRHGHRQTVDTKAPLAWLTRHPRVKRRGKVVITRRFRVE